MYEDLTESTKTLKRSFGLLTLVIFGIGDILGAGIYGLIGKVAGIAGYACWLSFVAAFSVAAVTALSYAELSARLPKSGGEAVFTEHAFRRKWLAYLIGFLVFLSGIVSLSTISHIFAGYLKEGYLVESPDWTLPVLRLAFLLGISLVTFWGINQSSVVNVVCTIVETSGLLVVITVAADHFGSVDYLNVGSYVPLANGSSVFPLILILQGGVLAFYAFIGFEDLVNVAEEVKYPRRHLPIAILIALGFAAVLYGLVSISAVSVLSPAELVSSEAPLLDVVHKAAPRFPVKLFSIVALFAVTNTALVNCVMCSRLLYGMAREHLVPSIYASINAKRRTPDIAIITVFAVSSVPALFLSKQTLGETTSFILLIVFFFVNLALIRIKLRKEPPPPNTFHVPVVVPVLGTAATMALACFVSKKALLFFFIMAPCGIALYLVLRLMRR